MGEFTFKMRLSSEQIEQLLELTKQDPTRRSIIARMNDGSYRVLGEIVKLPDCPQDEFDKALERLSELANGYEKEQPQPVRGSIAPEADFQAEYERYMESHLSGHPATLNLIDFARHFAEWGRTQKPSPQPKGNTEEFDDYDIALNG